MSLLSEQIQDSAISAAIRPVLLPVVPIEIQSCQKTRLTVLTHLEEPVQEFKNDVAVNILLQIKFVLIKLICYAVHIVSQCFGSRPGTGHFGLVLFDPSQELFGTFRRFYFSISTGYCERAVIIRSSGQVLYPRENKRWSQIVLFCKLFNLFRGQNGEHEFEAPVLFLVSRTVQFKILEKEQTLFEVFDA